MSDRPGTTTRPFLVLAPEDHVVLGESDFGMPGLKAVESIGPFTEIQASGPLVTVHDSTVDAGLGIGHHPHRFNERLFYIERGQLDHDDALNRITGHMDTGDVGQFTEGRRGMVHSEWNHGDVDTRAYILVYSTDPVPPHAGFNVLKDAEAPRSEEGAGVRTKELVGPRSPLRVHGDIRLFTDSLVEAGATLEVDLGPSEGGVVSVREGEALVDGEPERLVAGTTLVAPPAGDRRRVALRAAAPSRVVRVVHGPGHGFVRSTPHPRR
ncbi:MAG TPA: pirin family protein [Actinomycetota bacterium]|nr:pirin family protein [Actinomycetota bacterium]